HRRNLRASKKGGLESVLRSVERAPRSWQLSTVMAFLWPQPTTAPPPPSAHSPLRDPQARAPQHQQGVRRAERGLPARCLRRHPRRSPSAPRRGDRDRSPKLPSEGGQRAQRCPRQAAPHPHALSPFTGEVHRHEPSSPPVNFTKFPRTCAIINNNGGG